MRNFVLQDAVLMVRPNMRRNGFDIKLQTRLGIGYFIEGEFYARPGQQIEIIYNNVGEEIIPNVFPEPDGLPVAVVLDANAPNVHDANRNVIFHEIDENDRVIIQNENIYIERMPGINQDAPAEDDNEANVADQNDADENNNENIQ